MPEPISTSTGLTVANKTLTAATGLWGQRKRHLENMKSVIADVDPEWDGFTQDDGDVVGMLVRVRVSNHGAELVRSLTATMHHRATGATYSSKFVPALPAAESQVFAVPRILGLYEDQPFPEEETGWERAYWFEVRFVDLADKRWILQFSPRDNYQHVLRAWY